MTATATLADRKAMLAKMLADFRDHRAKLAAADRTGFAYTFRSVPGFVLHSNGNGMIGAAADRQFIRTTRLPAGHVVRNGRGDVAEFLPMADILDAAMVETDKAIAEAIAMGEAAGLV